METKVTLKKVPPEGATATADGAGHPAVAPGKKAAADSGAGGGAGADDDTAKESYYDDDDDDGSQRSYGGGGGGRPPPMPPLKYARIVGSLPRVPPAPSSSSPPTPCPALSVKITSSTMGRAVVRPPPFAERAHESPPPGPEWDELEDDEADLSLDRPCHVIALGFEDGRVRLVDALTGGSVLFGSSSGDGGAWFVNPSAAKRGGGDPDPGQRIAALCFDSGASHLCALNADGDAAIFGPLEWGMQSRRRKSLASGGGEGQQKFGFLFGGKAADPASASDKFAALRPPYSLIKPPASVRFTYADPQSFGSSLLGGGGGAPGAGRAPRSTCMALDPAYGRGKDRALVVGFDDGKLVRSRLQVATGGFTSLFGGGGGGSGGAGGSASAKKVDQELYQGMGTTSFSGDQAGIEAVAWRGGLIAWADSR